MRRLFWVVLAAGLISRPAAAKVAGCLDLLTSDRSPVSPGRLVTGEDLVALRDIGSSQAVDAVPILSLSPEGGRIAYQMMRAGVATNTYCVGIFTLDVQKGGRFRTLDVGGDPIIVGRAVSGFDDYTPGGIPSIVTPRWSPTGQSVAYLRRDNELTSLWLADASGSGGAKALTHLDYDVEDFVWAPDGQNLLISGRPGVTSAHNDLATEARSGYLLDDRSVPVVGSQPLTRTGAPTVISSVDLQSGLVTPTSLSSLVPKEITDAKLPAAAQSPLYSASGQIAWIEATDPGSVTSSKQLTRRRVNGVIDTCGPDLCDHIFDKWWSPAGETLYFLRRQGWANSQTGFYSWKVADDLPRQVFVTDDVLAGCVLTGQTLVCARESSKSPRRIVSIDVATAAERVLYDPNPTLAQVRQGKIERLTWTNNLGIESFGDLVLPPDYVPGTRLPLIVVQYRARGFPRGGIGDEYPILLLAAHGFAVLNFESPENVGIRLKAKTWDEVNRLDRVNWANRRSILSSLDQGIDLVIAKGVVDPERIGLTGLSDGASTVQFALINDHRFSAASISTCCDEPGIVSVLDGPATGRWLKTMGFPTFTTPDQTFWADMSLAQNACGVKVPLLMNLADREYLGALEALTALREYNKPVEAYVFPNEYHVKWQPLHRLAIYTRNLDWFSYWLKGEVDPTPQKASQYTRWQGLKRLQSPNNNASPGK